MPWQHVGYESYTASQMCVTYFQSYTLWSRSVAGSCLAMKEYLLPLGPCSVQYRKPLSHFLITSMILYIACVCLIISFDCKQALATLGGKLQLCIVSYLTCEWSTHASCNMIYAWLKIFGIFPIHATTHE